MNSFLQSFIVCSLSTPKFLALASGILVVYLALGTYYRYAERDCKRLVQMVQSPLYAHFSECLEGASIIRSFGANTLKAFEQECRRRVLLRNRAYYHM